MNESKFANIIVTVLVVLGLLVAANLILGLGLGILGLLFGLVGGILKIMFTKEFILLAGIGLVVYLVSNNRRERYRDTYPY